MLQVLPNILNFRPIEDFDTLVETPGTGVGIVDKCKKKKNITATAMKSTFRRYAGVGDAILNDKSSWPREEIETFADKMKDKNFGFNFARRIPLTTPSAVILNEYKEGYT